MAGGEGVATTGQGMGVCGALRGDERGKKQECGIAELQGGIFESKRELLGDGVAESGGSIWI